MKTKLIFLFFILTISLIAQNTKDEIKGQWKGCDKQKGYFEMIISDSLIYQRDSRIGGISSIPFHYTYENNSASLFYPNDSMRFLSVSFQVIDKNTMVRKYKDKEADTLKLIDKSTPYDNPDRYCEFEMTPSQYNDYLISQFWDRVIMNQHKCVPQIDFDLEFNEKKENLDMAKLLSELNDELNNDPDLKLPDNFQHVYTDKIEFEYIEETKGYSKPNLVKLKINEENGKNLAIVNFYGKCYDDVKIDFKIIDYENVDAKIHQTNLSCDKMCNLRLYFFIKTINYKLKHVNITDSIK